MTQEHSIIENDDDVDLKDVSKIVASDDKGDDVKVDEDDEAVDLSNKITVDKDADVKKMKKVVDNDEDGGVEVKLTKDIAKKEKSKDVKVNVVKVKVPNMVVVKKEKLKDVKTLSTVDTVPPILPRFKGSGRWAKLTRSSRNKFTIPRKSSKTMVNEIIAAKKAKEEFIEKNKRKEEVELIKKNKLKEAVKQKKIKREKYTHKQHNYITDSASTSPYSEDDQKLIAEATAKCLLPCKQNEKMWATDNSMHNAIHAVFRRIPTPITHTCYYLNPVDVFSGKRLRRKIILKKYQQGAHT